MVDEALALRKTAELQARLQRLREVLPEERATYEEDRGAQESVTLNLIIAIQSLVDLAAMVAADAGWPVPETMSATFEVLAENDVLSRELAKRLGAAVRMRNLLVHRYGDVDHGIVHDTVTRDLGDLEEAARQIVEHVEASG